MRVLVTDGDSRAALAVTRSLGRAHHEVVVGERRTPSLAQSSRYCAGDVVYPDPFREPDGFIEVIEREVRTRRIDVLLPITDVPTLLISRHRVAFESHCRVPLPSANAIERAADKVDTLKTAMRLGIPTPRSWFLTDPGAPIDAELPYPIVIKPHRSRVRTGTGWISCSVSYAKTSEELRLALSHRSRDEFPIVLQELIKGPGIGFFACCHRGSCVAVFSHRRIREKPPSGGVSVLSESVALCPRIREFSEELLKNLAWEGVAMVEFKMDHRDNAPRLMEINGRFWGSLQLAIDAGVDFPRILIDTLIERAPAAPPTYRVGVQSRWLFGDLDSLFQRLRCRRGPSIAGDRFRSVVEFLKPRGKDRYYENPRWDDIGPWLHETRRWLSGKR